MSEDQRGKSSTDLKFTSMPKQPQVPQEHSHSLSLRRGISTRQATVGYGNTPSLLARPGWRLARGARICQTPVAKKENLHEMGGKKKDYLQ